MAQLATPTITLAIEDKTTIRISGLAVAHAQGYQVRVATLAGGGVAQKVSPVDGIVTLAGRSPRSLYYVSARALGDDENYTNSDWSDEQTIQTGTDVDQSLAVPNIGAAAESFTTIAISGLTAYKEYRFQVATTAAGLDNAVPRIIGTGDVTAKIMGLEPGTAYFIRACLVEGAKCSLWSDVVSASTSEVSGTIEVTSGSDSGTGTLRQAISDATDGTRILLKVASITLTTAISTTQRLFIVGGLTDRTVISPGNNNSLFTAANFDFRHVKFTGTTGTNAITTSSARCDDVEIDSVMSTSTSGYISGVRLYRSVLSGNTAQRNNLNGSIVYDSVIRNNTATATSSGGLVGGGGTNNGILSNCLLVGNTATTSGGGSNGGTLTACTITGNSATNGGGAYQGTLTACTITGNSATNGGGAYQGTNLVNCLMCGNTNTINAADDYSLASNTVCSIMGSTIGVITHNKPTYLSIYNSLYKSWSQAPTGGNSNNLCYDGLEASYFVAASDGDYRLIYGSPAINAGDNQYVTTQTDLAGNPRIGNGTVDVGCYEFEPYKLPAPTFNAEVLPGGQATISYTLPANSSGFCLQYADNAYFDNAHEITAEASSFDLAGLSGNVWLRAKAVGITGQTVDSDWTAAQQIYVDTLAPIVTVNQTPLEIVYGETVDFLDGVTVSDDGGAQCVVHYQVLDADGQPVEVDGQTQDIPSSRIAKGRYTLRISATDDMGNTGHADRVLEVEPPRLPTPAIELKSIQGTTVVISGLLDSAAVGWLLSVDGAESPATPNAGGQVIIPGLADNTTHLIKAKALGDWVDPEPPEQPSGDFRDSVWSNTLSVTIGGDTPADAPVLSQKAITDHTLTLEVSGIGDEMSYIEIILATDARFASPVIVSKVPKAEIVIEGLKASQIYFVRARGYYGAEPTAFSSTLVVETLPIQSTSPADKLAYIRARIQLLRDYLAEVGNLSTISIDGISESRVDRASIRAELAELEAEESRLAAGGGRLRTIDARWVI